MRQIFFSVIGLTLASVTISMVAIDRSSVPTSTSSSDRCRPTNVAVYGSATLSRSENQSYISRILPRAALSDIDTAFYADSLDLECDGTADIVASILPKTAGKRVSRPTFVVYRQNGDSLHRILFAPARVDGVEKIAVVADLTGSGKQDLILIGGDEGGYSPRLFHRRESGFVEIPMPSKYRIRQEADWDAACMQAVNPRVLSGRRIQLLRETISPSATEGHGSSCSLPRDTLRLVGDSLIRAH